MPNMVHNIISISGETSDLTELLQFVSSNELPEDGELDNYVSAANFSFDKISPMSIMLHINAGHLDDAYLELYKKFLNGEELCAEDIAKQFNVPVPASIKNPTSHCHLDLSQLDKSEDCTYLYNEDASPNDKSPKTLGDVFEVGRITASNLELYGYKHWYDWRNHHWGTTSEPWETKIQCIDDYNLEIFLTTAWSAPDAILHKIVEHFPNLSFEGFSSDEDWYGPYHYHWNGGNGLFYYVEETPRSEILKYVWGADNIEDEEYDFDANE